MLLFVNSSIAQMDHGIPFNFCTLSGIQYNPGTHPEEGAPFYYNTWVTTDEDDELSRCEIKYIRQCFEDYYPNHTILEDSTVAYNCHGYSFSIFQGGDTCNICWFQEFCRNAFDTVLTPQAGDVAVIRTYGLGNNFEPGSIHSSIVVNQDTVISKWGIGCLTKHHKNDLINNIQIGVTNVYTYYRRIINTPNHIYGPYTFNGTGVFDFYPSITPTTCSWSVEPADMFQVSSGTGDRAILNYRTPFVYLAPKATITFTFGYGCDNHYTVSKEFDLRIPTTTISGNAISEGFIIDANATVTVTGNIKCNKNAKTIVPVGTKLILDGGTMTSNGTMWQGIEVWGNSNTHQYEVNGSFGQGYIELKNGAIIENAKCAVELWHPGIYSTTGGIIHATDAIFRNNAKSVHALHYSNVYCGVECSYAGTFQNCTFTVDDDFIGTDTLRKHVDL